MDQHVHRDQIRHYENNCAMVAMHQVAPHLSELDIIVACMSSGWREDMGMLPMQIQKALDKLRLEWTCLDDDLQVCLDDMRKNMTLNQALKHTEEHVCLIRVNGHVLASNRGIPLDTNMRIRGARRRVLGIYVIHNATIEARQSWAITENPTIQFVHDITHDTRKGSQRRAIYERVMKELCDPALPITFEELRPLGYTRRMLRRHIERGDAIIISS